MSEDENDNEMSMDKERKKLTEMGVTSTWEILTTGEKKKRPPEERKAFRGFN